MQLLGGIPVEGEGGLSTFGAGRSQKGIEPGLLPGKKGWRVWDAATSLHTFEIIHQGRGKMQALARRKVNPASDLANQGGRLHLRTRLDGGVLSLMRVRKAMPPVAPRKTSHVKVLTRKVSAMPTPLSRRDALHAALAAGTASALSGRTAADEKKPDARRASPKRYEMKKSINLWAFPYPQRMTLRECLQLAKDAGFDGIELNYDLESDLPRRPARRSSPPSARKPPASASPSAGCAHSCSGPTR